MMVAGVRGYASAHAAVNSLQTNPVGPLASLARASALGAVVALSCWVSILTRQPGSLSPVWIASGVLAGVLITSARSTWPGYLLVAFAANVLVRVLYADTWPVALGRGFASTLDAFLVAFALVHYVGDVTNPARVKRVAYIAIASTIGATALSGAIAAGVQAGFGTSSFGSVFKPWFASHTLGMVIFATLTVVARAQRMRLLGAPGHRIELALSVVLTALTTYAVFAQSRYPLLFLVFPPLLFGAFRHRFSGVVFGVTIVSAIAIVETIAGNGPFQLTPNIGSTERILLLQVFIASTCMLALLVAIMLTERMFLARRLRESERQYRILADYSRDLVVRIAADGRRLYVSPSATDMLGWDPGEFAGPRMDLVHPDDITPLTRALQDLFATGGSSTITYRVRHKDGHYVWIEAHTQRVPGNENSGEQEIIYSGRDVTQRIEAERALAENQRRLRAITDNMPAFVVHVDTEERYTFANAYTGMVMAVDPATIIGKRLRDVLDAPYYHEIKPHVDAALSGRTVTFEIERDFHGKNFCFQSTYVPDVDNGGIVHGFYVMSSDISQLKRTEQELSLLARYDSLTGLANRFHFNERVVMAIARQRRSLRPLALLYLDIDRFKQINDRHGHAVGDVVLREFAQRLKDSLRETDFAARLGGDEFIVLVEDVDTPEVPELIASRLLAAMQHGIATGTAELHVTTSIGIAFCRRVIVSQDELLQIADATLYKAKAAGRNTCRTAIVES